MTYVLLLLKSFSGKPRLATGLGGLVALTGLCIAQPGFAQTNIPITNFSFESPALSAGVFTTNGISGWTAGNSSATGVWNPTSSGDFSIAVPDGSQIGYTNSGSIAQQLSSTLQPGVYGLSAYGGVRNDGISGNFTLALWAGGTVANGVVTGGTQLVSATFNTGGLTSGFFYPVGTFYTSSAGNALIGQTLDVTITETTGAQADFDDVGLTLTSGGTAPEADTLALMLSASLPISGALVALRRRTQTSK